ncbi:MAG: ACT domain-containing protein, partial [Acidobacteria bacterium]|nr:ACT domain-containing protein [Acidobacteriota bacterium]
MPSSRDVPRVEAPRTPRPFGEDPIHSLQDARSGLKDAHFAGLSGLELVRALSAAMDAAVAGIWAEIGGRERGIALVALGGYGRGELSPHSDVDLMVLHGGLRRVGEIAGPLFYRLWDAGFQVGHATRTVKECLRLAATSLEAETSFLDARLVAGDAGLCAELASVATRATRRRGARFLEDLRRATAIRHGKDGQVSNPIEPNLKEGAGGLRDLQTIGWISAAFPDAGEALPSDPDGIRRCSDLLHRVRARLHYLSGRRSDVLSLGYQDEIALGLGYAGTEEIPADPFMRDLYGAARTIEHACSIVIAEMAAGSAPGAVESDPIDLAARPELPAALFAEAARRGRWVGARTERRLRERLAATPGDLPWTDEVRRAFFDLLALGDSGALEAFDHSGALVRYLPEWEPLRCRPQHNAYHRHTVDVHSFETVARLAALERDGDGLAGDVWRDVRDKPLLLLAGLLHDAGKGRPGDHSEAGERVAVAVADRMALDSARRATLAWLVRSHLLLADTASRRDLNDENLVVETAAAVGDPERLRMLYALTIADGLATGPAAWTPWKASLVQELFAKMLHVLDRGDLTSRDAMEVFRLRRAELRAALANHPDAAVRAHLAGMPRAYFLSFPTTELIRHSVASGDVRPHVSATGEPGVAGLTLVAPDRPGLFSTVSGALALNGLSIVSAQIYTRSDGAALEVFRVVSVFEPEIPGQRWERLFADLRAALRGTLAIEESLAEKRRAYGGRAPSVRRAPPRVVVDNRASDFYTVVEVHATDRIGLLHAITRALADLGLD